jgi:RNA polymerase sigma factor (sigma-70 family)
LIALKNLEGVEEKLLQVFAFPESLEEPEEFPALEGWEPEEGRGKTEPSPASLFAAITREDFPDHEEQLSLAYTIRKGREAAKRLEGGTGVEGSSWRLWARKRLLGWEAPPPVPLRELPRNLRLLAEEVLEGERAFLETVERNLRLVVAVAKRYLAKVPGANLMDLMAEGTLGLMQAAERFDPTLGYRFSTYAYYWVRKAITRHLTRDHLIYLPEERRREAASGDEDLAGLQAPLSLEEPLKEVDKLLGETIAEGPDPADKAVEAWCQRTLLQVLRDIGPLHGLVLGLHSGVVGGTPLSLGEVAGLLGISLDQAERLHKEAKGRLRHLLRVRGLEELAVD